MQTTEIEANHEDKIIREPTPYGKVLFVDDVETNLHVATGLLRRYRLQIDTAMSGREAIEKIGSGKVYDVVFMDHLMPEMDGVEAAKHLRSLGYTNPVVALTANASAGQKEWFLSNGFDDFLSKPIDTNQLDTILNQWKKADVILQPQDDALLLESFIRDAGKTVAVLEELKQRAEDDLRKFITTVHGIKSSLFNIGEEELSEAAFSLEQAGRERQIGQIAASAPGFLAELRSLLEKLGPALDADMDGIEEDVDDLCGKLLDIQVACADYDRKGALEILAGIRNVSKETKAVLDNIKECVTHSDFEEAENVASAFAAGLFDSPAQGQSAWLAGYEIAGLDIARGLERYDGDEDLYIKVLRSYAASVGAMLEAIETVSEDMLADYKIKVHGIKGTSYDFFATQIGKDAEALEHAATRGDFGYISEHHPAFLKDAHELVEAIEGALRELDAKNPKPKKDKPDSDALSKLLNACKNYDLDAADAAIGEIGKYQYEADDGLADWLREHMDRMDFTEIVERLSK